MINVFKIKKYGAFTICSMLPAITFFIGLVYYGYLWAIGFLLIGMILSFLIANLLVKNPFTEMLEGKGILCINLDSTGILKPFIVGVDSPYIRGNIDGKEIQDVFDRETVMQLATPLINKTKAKPNNKGGIDISLDEEEYNNGRFALFHYPVLIWNNQIKSIVTKDFFAAKEKYAFAEHQVLYLNRKMEELTSAVRDFGRHVVELTKPLKNIFTSKWTWIVIIIFLIILGILFLPSIIKTFGGVGSVVSTATAKNAGIITPIS